MFKRCSQFLFVIIVSLLINIVLFLMIPFLSQIKENKEQSDFIVNPTFVSRHRIEPKEENKEQPEPEKKNEPKPKTVTEKVVSHQSVKKSQPQMRFDLPKFDFKLSKMDMKSLSVQVPKQPPPSNPEPSTQSMQSAKSNYQLAEVDQKPQLISRVQPIYPYSAKNREITGMVVLKFIVNTKGEVTNISVVEAKPKGIFEQSAISAVKKWAFKPGTYQGEPVRTWVTVPITFELSN